LPNRIRIIIGKQHPAYENAMADAINGKRSNYR
jgi:hypothetical protein